MAEGNTIYARSCAMCHGANGEGSALGPKVAGHTASATKTQVRNPMGKMPAFPQTQVSNADLDKLADFIVAMAPPATRVVDWEKAATENIHHWMALLAIKGNDTADAQHHLRDSLVFIKDAKHQAEANKALDLLAKGNPHDAEHEIEEIVGAETPSGIPLQRFHLLLTMRAVEAKDAREANHHLDHFKAKATPKQMPMVTKALDLIAKNDFHEAEHEVEELMDS